MNSVPETIYEAQKNVHDIPRVTETHGAFDVPTAYKYQAELVARYVEEGSQIIGYKMGLTSRRKMNQMGVNEAAHGVLFAEMLLPDGKPSYDKLIHPKAEPEIAVRIAKDVPRSVNSETILAYIGHLAPAIDVIDSRFRDFSFTISDVVADNCSAAQFALGEWVPFDPEKIKIDNIQASLLVNYEVASSGSSFDVLGNPIYAVYDLQRALAREGTMLKEGDIILTGAITEASSIKEGDIVLNHTDIGDVQLN